MDYFSFNPQDRNPQNASLPKDLAPGQNSCDDCIALILAYGTSTTPLVVQFEDPELEPVECQAPEDEPRVRALQQYNGRAALSYAVQAALDAGTSEVYVLGPEDPQLFEQVAAVAQQAGATCCIPFDPEKSQALRLASKGYELFGLSSYVLTTGNQLLQKAAVNKPQLSQLLVMSCDQVRITGKHLRQLHARKEERPTAQVITSWIVWLRRLPLLIDGSFLARVTSEASSLANDLSALTVEEVVFGEEKLAASASWPVGFDDFFENLSLSALEALALARQGDVDDSPLTLSASDSLLIDLARETLKLAQDYSRAYQEELAWADTWGLEQKKHFPLFWTERHQGKFSYLDNAATTQRLDAAIEAQQHFDTEANANVYRGGYDLSMEATYALNDARKAVEDFIGANRRETIYTANTTHACNLVAQCWGLANLKPGDTILIPLCEHHSNLLPWMMLAQRTEARIAYIPLLPNGHLDMDAYKELLQTEPKVKLVCAAHVGNVLGIKNPVEEMARLAHQAGARMFVDGAQGLPHLGVDVYSLGADFFAFSGHKLYGPMGIGGLWVHPDAYQEMVPVMGGGGAISHTSVDSYYLRLGSIAYEWGTPPVSQAMGLAAAANHLTSIGMEQVQKHSKLLTRFAMDGLDALEGIRVFGDHRSPQGQLGLISLDVVNMAPAQIGSVLGKVGVAVRSGGHCALPLSASLGVIGTCRMSFGIYNTSDDVLAALIGLRLCRHLFRDDA